MTTASGPHAHAPQQTQGLASALASTSSHQSSHCSLCPFVIESNLHADQPDLSKLGI